MARVWFEKWFIISSVIQQKYILFLNTQPETEQTVILNSFIIFFLSLSKYTSKKNWFGIKTDTILAKKNCQQ